MTRLNRRQLLRSAGAGLATPALSPLYAVAADTAGTAKAARGGFTLPPLPYAYDALEPSIDKETMQIHHDKHHAAYVKNLNAALKDHPDFLKMDIVEVLQNVAKLPKDIQQAVINNGGGHLNHSLFWKWMAPEGKGGQPSGALAKAIDESFESLDKFKAKLSTTGVKQFGSGWAWLILDKGKLAVVGSANQNSPVLKGATPLLGVDVWEHAYYLKYQNRRPDYIAAWWKVVNWKDVDERYGAALKGA
jgi:superoxide dismutase, Fe-Mn family